MGRRKWKDSGCDIPNLDTLLRVCDVYGGVWWHNPPAIDRFINTSWVWGQRLFYLMTRLKKREFHFPAPTVSGRSGDSNRKENANG